MVHLTHSSLHWKLRCIADSDDENISPNTVVHHKAETKATTSSQSTENEPAASSQNVEEDLESTGTSAPPWHSPGYTKRVPKNKSNLPPSQEDADTVRSPHPPRAPTSPTTSSPLLLETPPGSPVCFGPRTKTLAVRYSGRKARMEAATPYARPDHTVYNDDRPVVKPNGSMSAITELPRYSRPSTSRSRDTFVPARWSCRVVHLREPYNPLATTFPYVPNFGWCVCSESCRVGTCRNSLMNVFCNINCCPFEGKCGNGLLESTQVFLGRSMQTSQLGVVAAEDIDAGEVLWQYLGELEHVSASRALRPRNTGYRLVMKQRPETPSHPVRVAINAEDMGGLMRFANHSCNPVAEFLEVANGRRTTVVVATTHAVRRGEEVTVDYGDDLWFVCRCQLKECRHRGI
ncbi:hypothetical protein PPTG_10170 [Phytophthora nicotianae INRA-310]|uniref:SET domain-containing protein n=1 Tax=Phytophthora nicotianae (strain INRA-310) TaxID=761204 RepID=W2QDF3_PHYN3|nr:hypothetical protein PPTG_10170 [Phytophthora nicotianae INRA-310]ETN11223.1 hypothetical protein PPTG_10170 [Phytophthora nicotianae INRA-310]